MTREEAIKIFSGIASLAKINTEPTMSVCNVKNEVFTEIQALLSPQPNPTTGLVPCRWCGGEAGFHYATMLRDDDCYVECGICGEHSNVALSEEGARDAWNYFMGYRGK